MTMRDVPYRGLDDGMCPAREDTTHCVCWWDDPDAACCSCGHGKRSWWTRLKKWWRTYV